MTCAARDLTADQVHALLIVGCVAYGMDRAKLVRACKSLMTLGLVTTTGAHCGHNRSQYHWSITKRGCELLAELGMPARADQISEAT